MKRSAEKSSHPEATISARARRSVERKCRVSRSGGIGAAILLEEDRLLDDHGLVAEEVGRRLGVLLLVSRDELAPDLEARHGDADVEARAVVLDDGLQALEVPGE